MDFNRLPKVELHCHLDGIVDPAMLRALRRQGHPLPLTPEQLQAAYPVRNFDDFIRWFEIAQPLEGKLDNFKLVLAEHVRRLKAQNVVYAELMIGTSELRLPEADMLAKVGAFREYVTSLEAGQIQVEFLVAAARTRSPESFAAVAERVIRLRAAGLVVGVALAGWPEAPIRPHTRALRRLRDAGVGLEIHAGEWAGPESVWDALEYGFPHRLGHGVALFQDPRLVERVLAEQIHVEMCPTSNLKTGSVARIEDHPVRLARDLRLNFSLNTDDPGPFECSLASEYRLAAETFGFDAGDFERLYHNALSARFQPALRYLPAGGDADAPAGATSPEPRAIDTE